MIFPKLSLSHKKHLPVWSFADSTFLLWRPDKPLSVIRKFKVKKSEGLYSLQLFDRKIFVLPYYLSIVNEVQQWKDYYLPISVKGKVVLDVGAGCGESALFYFNQGAKRVIMIEADPIACGLAKQNMKGLDALIINEYFNPSHLDFPHDFMKMDIEGAESRLLAIPTYSKPFVVETHSEDLSMGFTETFGAKQVKTTGEHLAVLQRI